jgi:hypothetical protein
MNHAGPPELISDKMDSSLTQQMQKYSSGPEEVSKPASKDIYHANGTRGSLSVPKVTPCYSAMMKR